MLFPLFAAAVTATVLLGPPALADTPGCVSQRELNRVEIGWRMPRVHRVFDTKGNVTKRTDDILVRSYRLCPNDLAPRVVASYMNHTTMPHYLMAVWVPRA